MGSASFALGLRRFSEPGADPRRRLVQPRRLEVSQARAFVGVTDHDRSLCPEGGRPNRRIPSRADPACVAAPGTGCDGFFRLAAGHSVGV